jgi:GNAT superfamily N-acetyltransferase
MSEGGCAAAGLAADERIEAAALAALHAAAGPALAARLGLDWRPIGSGAASIAAALPTAIVVNRALGLDGPKATRAAIAAYRAARVTRYFLNGVEGTAEAAASAEGLVPARGWRKFVRGRDEPVPDVAPPLPIREIAAGDGAAFGRLAAAAFDLGDAAGEWLARLPGSPGWQVFGAYDGDRLAAIGALFRLGDEAWTDWGATAPAWRGRGLQRALLARRVRLALEGGATTLRTCTGEAVAGEPQHSYANILRCGFREGRLRPNLAPPKPAT